MSIAGLEGQDASIDITTADSGQVDISVVMPCLNEEHSVGICVRKALEGISRTGLRGEVVICDNGSSDNSIAVAEEAGARVVRQPMRGYGNAYLKGFSESHGRIVVMGDSDDTYDFGEIPALIQPLLTGEADYVLGSRFGGQILDGAMSFSHRYIGNPILTGVLNRFFGLKSSDAHSGLRAFTREALDRMRLRCEGMEFASEIVVKAARAGLRVAEVPITYHPRKGESKLQGVRDAWRHMRFMLILSPKWLFIYPGLIMFLLGFIGQSALLPGRLWLGNREIGVHVSILFSMLTLVGTQALAFGAFSRAYGKSLGLDSDSRMADWVERDFSLERGLMIGAVFVAAGVLVDVSILLDWVNRSMGALDAIRPALFATTFVVMGVQILFGSFFLSIFRIKVHALPVASELQAS